MSRPRLTVRCATDDLSLENWDRTGPLTGFVGQATHPVLDRAVTLFRPDRDSSQSPDKISGVRPPCSKVKTDRHRAAAYEDPDGQIWIVGAGNREAGSREDFYKKFASLSKDEWLPTQRDAELLSEEAQVLRLRRWELSLQEKVGDWLASENLTLPLTLNVTTDGLVNTSQGQSPKDHSTDAVGKLGVILVAAIFIGDDLLGVEVSGEEVNWLAGNELLSVALLAAARRVDNHEQHWSVAVGSRSGTGTKLVLEFSDEHSLADAISNGDRETPPETFTPGEEAHYIPVGHHCESDPTTAAFQGHVVRSLCGTAFVPRQDPATKQMCEKCQAIMDALDRLESNS